MTPITAVIFDKDGTLFSFAETWEAWAASLLARLCPAPDMAHRLGQLIGFDTEKREFKSDSIVIAGTVSEIAAAMLPGLPHMSASDLTEILNEEAGQAPQIEAVPLAPFLDDLRQRGLKIGLATNDAEAPARAHLSAAGVTEQFDFISGFDSGFGGKPAPGQLLAFADRIGQPAETIVMVGDSTHDLLAAKAAGMVGLGVLTGMACEADLAPYADAVLADIGEIPVWLDQRSG